MKNKLVNTSTLKGLKKAERMHATGKYRAPSPLKDYKDILVFIPR